MAPVIAETPGCVECGAPAWIEALIRPDALPCWFCRAHAYHYMKIEAAIRDASPTFDEHLSISLRRLCAQAVFAGRYRLPLRLLPPDPIEFTLHKVTVAVRPVDAQWGLLLQPQREQAQAIVAASELRGRASLVGWAWRVEVERCARIRKNGSDYHTLPVQRLRPIDGLEAVCRAIR